MDYIDIKLRIRPGEPMLFTKLLSTNKRHRAELARTYIFIGHTIFQAKQVEIPAIAGLSNRHLENSPQPDKNPAKKRVAPIERGKDGIPLSQEDYSDCGNAVEKLLNNAW